MLFRSVDTRDLTRRIRAAGAPTGVLAHDPKGRFDVDGMLAQARAWPGLEGMDLAREVSTTQAYEWGETRWGLQSGYGKLSQPRFRVVAVDYGAKHNILRCLASAGCAVTVVPATASAEDILRRQPDGVFLSNGPGDPAATGQYAVPAIRGVLESGVPLFGICLGHQLLGLALGGTTHKMHQGHRGANHPVKDLATGKVEITSQNHGFTVAAQSLPGGVTVTHVSLFDQTVEGLAVDSAPAFSVQYHPEASPGPQDTHHLFARFVGLMEQRRRCPRCAHSLRTPTSSTNSCPSRERGACAWPAGPAGLRQFPAACWIWAGPRMCAPTCARCARI